MNSTTKAIILVVLIIIIGVGGYLLINNSDSENAESNTSINETQDVNDSSEDENSLQPETQDTNENAETSQGEATAEATITYTNQGFSPSDTTVSSGAKLTIVNNSSEDLEFSSDDHPEHTDNSELNTDTLAPGESTTITLTRKGTWSIHDHLDSSKTATVEVQ